MNLGKHLALVYLIFLCSDLLGKVDHTSMKRILRNVHIGRVLSYKGESYIDEIPLNSKEHIFVNSTLSTGEGSLVIALGRETVVNLAKNTVFQIVRLKPREDSRIIGVAGMLIEGKIQGINWIQENGTQIPISIVSPRGEFMIYGGRFAMEVPPDHNSKVLFLSLDKPAQLALFTPQELIVEKNLKILHPEVERTGFGIGLVSTPLKDPKKEGRTLNLQTLQLCELDFSSGKESLSMIPLDEKQALEGYNSKILVHFILEKQVLRNITPIAGENIHNMETFNFIPNMDQIVNANFSNTMITLDF